MTAMPQPHPARMTADAFLAWAVEEGFRGELVDGEVVAMAPERIAHARVKSRVLRALEDASAAMRLPCEALPDGVAVQVSDATVFEPDALLRCGPPLPGEAVKVEDPLIVVEVVSPSSRSTDTGLKLAAYFRIPSLRHYLILHPGTRTLIHHAREAQDGPIATRILRDGAVTLDPPGIRLDIAALFGPPPPG